MPFGPEDQRTALEAIERQGNNLTVWEEEFVENLRRRIDAGEALTRRQAEILEDIYAKKAS